MACMYTHVHACAHMCRGTRGKLWGHHFHLDVGSRSELRLPDMLGKHLKSMSTDDCESAPQERFCIQECVPHIWLTCAKASGGPHRVCLPLLLRVKQVGSLWL